MDSTVGALGGAALGLGVYGARRALSTEEEAKDLSLGGHLAAGGLAGIAAGNIVGDRGRRYLSNKLPMYGYDSSKSIEALTPKSWDDFYEAAILDRRTFKPKTRPEPKIRRELLRRGMGLPPVSQGETPYLQSTGVRNYTPTETSGGLPGHFEHVEFTPEGWARYQANTKHTPPQQAAQAFAASGGSGVAGEAIGKGEVGKAWYDLLSRHGYTNNSDGTTSVHDLWDFALSPQEKQIGAEALLGRHGDLKQPFSPELMQANNVGNWKSTFDLDEKQKSWSKEQILKALAARLGMQSVMDGGGVVFEQRFDPATGSPVFGKQGKVFPFRPVNADPDFIARNKEWHEAEKRKMQARLLKEAADLVSAKPKTPVATAPVAAPPIKPKPKTPMPPNVLPYLPPGQMSVPPQIPNGPQPVTPVRQPLPRVRETGMQPGEASGPRTLGGEIQRYYGGREGLDKAVADAQAWQAKRPEGTGLSAFAKWTPEYVDREVSMRRQPRRTLGAAGSYDGWYSHQSDSVQVADDLPAWRASTTLEHELTHAMTANGSAVYPFSRLMPPKTDLDGVDREHLDYLTTPVEMDPRLAGIKRTYTALTGESVNTPEAARRAWEFTKNYKGPEPPLPSLPWRPRPQAPVVPRPGLPSGTDTADIVSARQQWDQYDQQMNERAARTEALNKPGKDHREVQRELPDDVEAPFINYIDQNPAVRDIAMQRMLELVNNSGRQLAVANKAASTAFSRAVSKNLLSPQAIKRVTGAMPAGQVRQVGNKAMGQGQFAVTDKVVGNLGGGHHGVFARKLPTRDVPGGIKAQFELPQQLAANLNRRYSQPGYDKPFAEYPVVNERGAFQELSTGKAPPPSPAMLKEVGDLHPGNIGPGGQIHDFSIQHRATSTGPTVPMPNPYGKTVVDGLAQGNAGVAGSTRLQVSNGPGMISPLAIPQSRYQLLPSYLHEDPLGNLTVASRRYKDRARDLKIIEPIVNRTQNNLRRYWLGDGQRPEPIQLTKEQDNALALRGLGRLWPRVDDSYVPPPVEQMPVLHQLQQTPIWPLLQRVMTAGGGVGIGTGLLAGQPNQT